VVASAGHGAAIAPDHARPARRHRGIDGPKVADREAAAHTLAQCVTGPGSAGKFRPALCWRNTPPAARPALSSFDGCTSHVGHLCRRTQARSQVATSPTPRRHSVEGKQVRPPQESGGRHLHTVRLADTSCGSVDVGVTLTLPGSSYCPPHPPPFIRGSSISTRYPYRVHTQTKRLPPPRRG